ncbi:MAG: threonylcarbamoyl-AMP synthase [Alistipes sp.]|nr:threonylcarbamoyl-AMP synthase [Alistipes sp.]
MRQENRTQNRGQNKPNAALAAAVDEAVKVLRAGGLILYPTDTVWGIGCDATNEEAVQRIYALKQSENKHAMLVLCPSADEIVRYVNRAPGIAFEVMEMATSPLTLILPGAVGVAKNLIPDEGTLGVRVPDHAFCQLLLRKLGRPLVSTSANISGEKTPRTLSEITPEIVAGVDYVVNPRFEGRPTGKSSSIIAFGENGEVRVIRE